MSRRIIRAASLLTRWAARLTGALLAGLLLLLVIGQSPPLRILFSPITLGILASIAGMVLGWKWEALGGAAILLACVGMNVYHVIVWHRWLIGGAFPLFWIPGVLLLLSAGLHAWERRLRPAGQ